MPQVGVRIKVGLHQHIRDIVMPLQSYVNKQLPTNNGL